MLRHEGFAKLAFTGSTEVGYTVAKAAADRLIPATLELGGKSANIFFSNVQWKEQLKVQLTESYLTKDKFALQDLVFCSRRHLR